MAKKKPERKTVKVYVNAKPDKEGKYGARQLVKATLLEDRGPTIFVELPDGNKIVRKKKRDLENVK